MKVTLPDAPKILVLKPRAIGDVLLMTPLLRAIRARYPKGTNIVATEGAAAPALERNTHVDSVWIWEHSVAGTFALIRKARAGRFDAVVDAFGNPRTAIVSILSGCRVRVGYDVRVRRFAYTHVVRRLPAGNYNVNVQLELLKPLGIEPAGDRPQLFLSPEERSWAAEAISAAGHTNHERLVGLNPGGSWVTKRWFASRYGALARSLAGKTGTTVLVLWGPGEEEIAEKVVAIAAHPRVVAIPRCTLRQMAALIEKMALLVTNDAAAKHMAVALGVPSLALHGPTDHRAWHPPDLGLHRVAIGQAPCAPCELTRCSHMSCMADLSVERVAADAASMLPR